MRKMNKKYFGNTNTSGLGGEGVASVTIDTPGSYTTATTVTFSAPDLAGPGGTTATGTIVYEALSATISGTMTGYQVGDLLTVTTAGGTAIAYVATIGGTGGDDVTAVNFTDTGADRGSFTSLAAGAQATTTGGAGAGCLLTVTYRVKSITITEPGTGYTNAADAAVSFGAGAAAGTAVLTSTKQNAITISAYIPAANGGSSAVTGDIVKQVSGTRFKIKTAQGTGICKLVTGAPGAGEARITATDSAGGTYYIKKISNHRATVLRGSGTQFADNQTVPWTFDAATLNSTIKMPNT